jgi:hypothetical protein
MVLSLLLTWYFVQRKIPLKLDNQTIVKSVMAGGVMALAIEAFQLLYYSRYLLLVYLSVGFVVYLLAMRALRAVNAADMNLIRQILGPRFCAVCDLLALLIVH